MTHNFNGTNDLAIYDMGWPSKQKMRKIMCRVRLVAPAEQAKAIVGWWFLLHKMGHKTKFDDEGNEPTTS